nr:IclR family transcriptional regulator [Pseudonocardia acidicola]
MRRAPRPVRNAVRCRCTAYAVSRSSGARSLIGSRSRRSRCAVSIARARSWARSASTAASLPARPRRDWTPARAARTIGPVRSAHRNETPNSVLGRAFTLLTAFRPGDAELSLAELCRRTGLPKATAHRLLAELADWDIVERTPTGVRLGMRLFELGQLAPLQRGLREAAAPFLTDLFEATLETVHLAVPDGTDVVYVQKIDGRRGPAVASRVGGRMPAYCTGVGKALLAFGPPERLAAVLAAGLERRTPRTVIAPGLLDQELAAVRRRGVAEEHEESTVGIACVAAPVLDAAGLAVAAVSITGWVNRMDTTRLAPAVRTAAMGISRVLRRGD